MANKGNYFDLFMYFQWFMAHFPFLFTIDIEDLLKQTPLTPPSSEKGSPLHITQFGSDGESPPGSPMYESGKYLGIEFH